MRSAEMNEGFLKSHDFPSLHDRSPCTLKIQAESDIPQVRGWRRAEKTIGIERGRKPLSRCCPDGNYLNGLPRQLRGKVFRGIR